LTAKRDELTLVLAGLEVQMGLVRPMIGERSSAAARPRRLNRDPLPGGSDAQL